MIIYPQPVISAAQSVRLHAELLAQPVPQRACCRAAEAIILLQLPGGQFSEQRLQTLLGIAQARSPQLTTRLHLIDQAGHRRRGLPPGMAARAGLCCATAMCRAALLSAGAVSSYGQRLRVFVDFPDVELAVAVAGAARRLGTPGQLRPTSSGGEQLRIPDGAVLLHQLGVSTSINAWQHHSTRPARSTRTRTSSRDRTAGDEVRARFTLALQQLGDTTIPAEFADAARLRLQHPDATLTELGALSDPPVGKHTIAGRLRRFLHRAEKHTSATVPDHEP